MKLLFLTSFLVGVNSLYPYKQCLSEYSTCSNTSTEVDFNNGSNNLTYSTTANVNITCGTTETIQIREVEIKLYINSSMCEVDHLDMQHHQSCRLTEMKLLAIGNIVNDIKTIACTGNICETTVDYNVNQTALIGTGCAEQIVVGSPLVSELNLFYTCDRDCEDNSDQYFEFWHTLEKDCTSVVNASQFVHFHMIVSVRAIVDVALKAVLSASINSQAKVFNISEVEDQIQHLAVNNITEDACELLVYSNSKVTIGSADGYGNVLTSFIRTYPTIENENQTMCQQRLIVMKENDPHSIVIICPHNDSSFLIESETNGKQPERYFVWYEQDATRINTVFFMPIEVSGGKAVVRCGFCTANISSDTTSDGNHETSQTKFAGDDITKTIIIAVSVASAVVIVILVGALIAVLIKYNQPVHVDVPSEYMSKEDTGSLYDEIVDTQLDENCYNTIPDESNITETYLTQGQIHIKDTYLTQPDLLYSDNNRSDHNIRSEMRDSASQVQERQENNPYLSLSASYKEPFSKKKDDCMEEYNTPGEHELTNRRLETTPDRQHDRSIGEDTMAVEDKFKYRNDNTNPNRDPWIIEDPYLRPVPIEVVLPDRD